MTELMIERIKNASSMVGKILYSAYYSLENIGNIAIESDRITGYKIEHEKLYLLLENSEPVEETFVDSDALEIELFPYHKDIVLTAHSTIEKKAKERILKIKEEEEIFENEYDKIKISPYTKFLLNKISKYEKKNGIKFNIDRFIESSYQRLKNADKDFEEYLTKQEEEEL